ncbi:Dysbindin-A Biogenesis of lysosome-related organelles complex 1 subunit 8-A [Collichthys lucidus]|uniref:Dysbindin-A Biogenesis of lysosome-related organelles complex 1 subunit 8-A n=1 Tax=Collichthys lucidus TaxID=240159 RepID=A0A4U5V321_COLLU|nr:Dysbindin-A Biogenesis of lysosome-related organelles complex 1 subunit 8-A [Collichthys lucidus]
MESRLVYLETLCCQCEQQTFKQHHINELNVYKKKKRREVEVLEVELNSEHAQKVAELEQAMQQKLREQQKVYEEAFNQDMKQYLSTGYLQHRRLPGLTLGTALSPATGVPIPVDSPCYFLYRLEPICPSTRDLSVPVWLVLPGFGWSSPLATTTSGCQHCLFTRTTWLAGRWPLSSLDYCLIIACWGLLRRPPYRGSGRMFSYNFSTNQQTTDAPIKPPPPSSVLTTCHEATSPETDSAQHPLT